MKVIWFLSVAVVMGSSCKENKMAAVPVNTASPAAKEQTAISTAEPTVQEDQGESTENQRTRAQPRPEVKPHPKPKDPYNVAEPVKGRPGFVVSPYNGKIIDVRDLPPGTLVMDPTSAPESKSYFRVPEPEPVVE